MALSPRVKNVVDGELKDEPWARLTKLQEMPNPLSGVMVSYIRRSPVVGDHPGLSVFGGNVLALDPECATREPAAPSARAKRVLFRTDIGDEERDEEPIEVYGLRAFFSVRPLGYQSLKHPLAGEMGLPLRYLLKMEVQSVVVQPVEPLVLSVFILSGSQIMSERWGFTTDEFAGWLGKAEGRRSAAFDVTQCERAAAKCYIVVVYYRPFQVNNGELANEFYRKPTPGSRKKAEESLGKVWPAVKGSWTPFAVSFAPLDQLPQPGPSVLDLNKAYLLEGCVAGGDVLERLIAQSSKVKQPLQLGVKFQAKFEHGIEEDQSAVQFLDAVADETPRLCTAAHHELVVTLSSAKVTLPEVHNLAVEVLLRNGVKDPQTRFVRGRFQGTGVVESQLSSVLYHDDKPRWEDEFVIALPIDIDADAYLVFKFYHVSTNREALMQAGVAILPLWEGRGDGARGFLTDGMHELGVAKGTTEEVTAPTLQNKLVIFTRLKSVLISGNTQLNWIIGGSSARVRSVKEVPLRLAIGSMFAVLDHFLWCLGHVPDAAPLVWEEIIALGDKREQIPGFELLMNAYIIFWAFRKGAVNQDHIVLLGSFPPLMMNEQLLGVSSLPFVAGFVFKLVLKALAITHEGPEGVQPLVEAYVRALEKVGAKMSPDRFDRLNCSFGDFVRGLVDVGHHEAAARSIVDYVKVVSDRPDAMVAFLDRALYPTLVVSMTLADSPFVGTVLWLIERAVQKVPGLIPVVGKLFSFFQSSVLPAIAQRFVSVLFMDFDGIPKGSEPAMMGILVEILKYVNGSVFASAWAAAIADVRGKFFELLHSLLSVLKFSPKQQGQAQGVTAQRSVPGSGSADALSKTALRLRRGSGKGGAPDEDAVGQLPNPIVRQLAAGAQVGVLRALAMILECDSTVPGPVVEVLFHVVTSNIALQAADPLGVVLRLLAERHAVFLIRNRAPPLALIATKLFALPVGPRLRAAAASFWPAFFAAELAEFGDNKRGLAIGVRALSMVTITPALVKDLSGSGELGAVAAKIAGLNAELKRLDPVAFAAPGSVAPATCPIERFGDVMWEKACGWKLSPDARLEAMLQLAAFWRANNYLSEALMCHVVAISLIWEMLAVLRGEGPGAGAAYSEVCPSCDSVRWTDDMCGDRVPSFCDSSLFGPPGVAILLSDALDLGAPEQSGLVETVVAVLLITKAIFEQYGQFEHLSELYKRLAQFYQLSATLPEAQRLANWGAFYRVSLLGEAFGPDQGKVFVQREPLFAKLAEVVNRLRGVYSKLVGHVEVLKESGRIDPRILDPQRAFIQVTFVKQVVSDRQTAFERNTNLTQFQFDSPFTKGGARQQGSIESQWLRRSTLTIPSPLPGVVKRVEVADYRVTEVEPIRVRTDQFRAKAQEMQAAASRRDFQSLVPLVKGTIMTEVNEGPAAVARVFLESGLRTAETKALKDTMRRLLSVSRRSLDLMQDWVATDRSASGYQPLLVAGNEEYEKLERQLTPLLEDARGLTPAFPAGT